MYSEKLLIENFADSFFGKQQMKNVPNFKTKALAIQRLKGKENCESERRRTATLIQHFVQKSNATK